MAGDAESDRGRAALPDTPGVAAPPPVLYGLGVVVGLGLQWIAPLPLPGGAGLRGLGILLVAAGLVLGGLAAREFRRHHTSINPYRPSTAVLQSGPFGWSRNPVYLGLTLAQLGLGLALANGWIVLLLVPILLVMRGGVIAREERYLARRFGAEYEAYRSRVRRWL
jgi:protein-S-isoprenylcysteine O-methyltransferase Ste14